MSHSIKKIDLSGDASGKLDIDLMVSSNDAPGVSQHNIYLVDLFQKLSTHKGGGSTINRAKMKSGGAKPYRQKGTGNARRGTNRSPLRRGGAVIFGPQPRSFSISLNKKMVKMGLASTVQATIEKISLLVGTNSVEISTKKIAGFLNKVLGSKKDKVVLVLDGVGDQNLEKSCRNIKNVTILRPNAFVVSKVLDSDRVFITESAFDSMKNVMTVGGKDV